MKRILIPFLFAALTASAERENLWPAGKMPDAQPHQVAKMTNEKGDNAAPYIDWLPAPEKPNGCCMILISGGAYKNCCDVGRASRSTRARGRTGSARCGSSARRR